jgi:hypothetical protein
MPSAGASVASTTSCRRSSTSPAIAVPSHRLRSRTSWSRTTGRIVRRLARCAGIDKQFSPHSLRHAAITAALDARLQPSRCPGLRPPCRPWTDPPIRPRPRRSRPQPHLHRRHLPRRRHRRPLTSTLSPRLPRQSLDSRDDVRPAAVIDIAHTAHSCGGDGGTGVGPFVPALRRKPRPAAAMGRSESMQSEHVPERDVDRVHRARAQHAAAIFEVVLVHQLEFIGHRSSSDRSVTVAQFHHGR